MYRGRIIPEKETGNDPFYNIALEQAILSLHSLLDYDCTIRFWRNEKSVVLGRNQDIESEINIEYCKKHGILITRRVSGGGTVYQDLGNLNVSIFINKKLIPVKNPNIKQITAHFTELIKNSLYIFGINNLSVEKSSNILYNGLKISGSAGYNKNDWILHHFTILQNVDLINIDSSLLARPGYEVNKSRASNYYKTTNLPKSFELSKWKGVLITQLKKGFNISFEEDHISNEEYEHGFKLKETMYKTKKWIYNQKRID
jgi:lipoate-protein ligase A